MKYPNAWTEKLKIWNQKIERLKIYKSEIFQIWQLKIWKGGKNNNLKPNKSEKKTEKL